MYSYEDPIAVTNYWFKQNKIYILFYFYWKLQNKTIIPTLKNKLTTRNNSIISLHLHDKEITQRDCVLVKIQGRVRVLKLISVVYSLSCCSTRSTLEVKRKNITRNIASSAEYNSSRYILGRQRKRRGPYARSIYQSPKVETGGDDSLNTNCPAKQEERNNSAMIIIVIDSRGFPKRVVRCIALGHINQH